MELQLLKERSELNGSYYSNLSTPTTWLLAGGNVNNGTEVTTQLNFFSLVTIFLPLAAVIGNWAVILSVKREKSLQTSTNFLIVSLAVADLLVGLIVMPWGIFALVSSQWTLPYIICDIYMTMDVICSTASIFNLVAISVDRYRAIRHPLEYSQNQAAGNHRLVCGYILAVWGVAAAVGLPILFGLNDRGPLESHEVVTCEFHNPDFIICSSVLSFYIPCIVIIFIYFSIFKMIVDRDRAKKAKLHASTAASLRPTESVLEKQEVELLLPPKEEVTKAIVKTSISAKGAADDAPARDDDHLKSPVRALASSQPDMVKLQIEKSNSTAGIMSLTRRQQELDPESGRTIERSVSMKFASQCQRERKCRQVKSVSTQVDLRGESSATVRKGRLLRVSFKRQNSFESESGLTTPDGGQPQTPVEKFKQRMKMTLLRSTSSLSASLDSSAGNLNSPRSGVRGLGLAASAKILTKAANWRAKSVQAKNERRERRATKTLAIVLGCFLFCWIPFFSVNTLSAISIKLDMPELRPSMSMFLITTWLGYVNSILNPIIYTLFNREFRKAIVKILHLNGKKNLGRRNLHKDITEAAGAAAVTNV